MSSKRIAIVLIGLAGTVGCSRNTVVSPPPDSSAALRAIADEYFDQVYFRYAPSNATSDGFHQYDTQLEDYSRAAVDRQTADLQRFEARFDAIPAGQLDLTSQGDRELLLGNIHSTLLALNTIRLWEKNPDQYSSGISNAAFVLMERDFASPDDRLRSLIAREKQMPAALEAAHQNLKNPPHIYTEIALEQLPDIIAFFQSDVPKAFEQARDPELKHEFAQSNGAVITALKNYQSWLRNDVLSISHGDFRFGPDTFAKLLLYDEMVDTPLPRLLEIGYADLHQNQAEFNRIAHELEPGRKPREVLGELGGDHPAPDHLLESFHDTFEGLIRFIHEKHIVDIPSQVQPTLENTPPFMRATTTASMDTPGPFEKVSTKAYFNVTVPDAHDSKQQMQELMAEFNRGTIISTAIHEAYPGHYVQFLWVPQAPTKVRKLLGASSNAEGWAHYCEQMMLDEGYGQPGTGARDVRDAKMIRLGQLQDALLRDARFVVGIQMHTGNMTFNQAVKFFVDEGYQSPAGALVESKRGTTDATYLYYTLGKLEILKLRADLKKKEGEEFSLERFHDDFLKQGFPPIKIVRRALLGDTSPTL
ncbi:MAG TPA: DUF885 domain-containing protein [Acidobacteriaceae bacterium]|nr:DUF885 domain-containing protein [Acidobacteriaceae bacterium]